jgi:hypothetical protein
MRLVPKLNDQEVSPAAMRVFADIRATRKIAIGYPIPSDEKYLA